MIRSVAACYLPIASSFRTFNCRAVHVSTRHSVVVVIIIIIKNVKTSATGNNFRFQYVLRKVRGVGGGKRNFPSKITYLSGPEFRTRRRGVFGTAAVEPRVPRSALVTTII